MPGYEIGDVDALRAHYGEPKGFIKHKQLPALNQHSRRFIEMSPLVLVATSGAGDGPADCSPRGDAPGFVAILDDRTIAIPDRPGNRRVDKHQNIVSNPQVGMLFMVPGINEMLRVNGKARLTTDPALLARMAANGKPPLAAIVVDIAEAFFHCGKALIRADLWNPARHVERKSFPTLVKISADQYGVDEASNHERAEREYVENLY
ncbi:MAG: pyridoxamine 5'-phosphate oxidase family protein [Alphaproteobacteria bacterium]|nr:pyridoxamine 5'-phosphate oxidase family protein [Alphaproteobacteria bacterium]